MHFQILSSYLQSQTIRFFLIVDVHRIMLMIFGGPFLCPYTTFS
nr:MAG TPA: hypothetical protein [Caudoviricetes sp.]